MGPSRFIFQSISSQQAQSQPSCPFRLESHVISVGGVDVYMEKTFPTEARMENIAVHMIFPEKNTHIYVEFLLDNFKAVLVKTAQSVSTRGSCGKNMSRIFPKFVNSKL